MPRDAAATRARILVAAVAEFSAFGLAGARVDRIAAAAAANKRSIYVHFGSKEGLFDAALHEVISALTAAVPLTAGDLPGYAGRLFDQVLRDRAALRLTMWRQLERPSAGPDEGDVYRAKVRALTAGPGGAQEVGDAALPAMDLLVLVQAMASAWLVSPADLLAAGAADPTSPARLASHRAALVEAVRRLTLPRDASTPHTGRTPP